MYSLIDFDFLSTIKRRAFLWANPLCLFVCGIKCLTICETNDIRKRAIIVMIKVGETDHLMDRKVSNAVALAITDD